MKKLALFKILISFIMLLALCLVSACSWRLESVDQLIKAPKLSGEYASLQEAFDKFLKEQGEQNCILKPPLSGDYRSAYVLHDLNGDNINEALIFYSYRNNPNVIRVNILKNENNQWISIADYEGGGHSVFCVDFEDLSNDNIKEILISWTSSDENNKNLSVLACEANQENQILSINHLLDAEEYTEMLILDIDFDKTPEVFIAYIDSPGTRAIAKLLYYDTKANKIQIRQNGIIELDSRATNYKPLKYDVVNNNGNKSCRIYIDTIIQRSPDTMVTEIILWDNNRNRLISPTLSLETHAVSNDTLRTAKLEETKDIDGDKKLDIPTYSKLIDSEVFYSIAATTEDLYVVEWKNYTNDVFKTTLRYIDYGGASFRFLVPDDFSKFTVFINATENNRMEFFELDSENHQSGDRLFILHTFNAKQWLSVSIAAENELDFIKMNNDKSLIYACEVFPKGKEKGISPETLSDLIMLTK